MRQVCIRLPMVCLLLAGLQGPQELWPQVTWSESASGDCVLAFILCWNQCLWESSSDREEMWCWLKWDQLEKFMCTLMCVLSIMWQDPTEGFLATRIWERQAGFNFQVRQIAGGGGGPMWPANMLHWVWQWVRRMVISPCTGLWANGKSDFQKKESSFAS